MQPPPGKQSLPVLKDSCDQLSLLSFTDSLSPTSPHKSPLCPTAEELLLPAKGMP